MGPQSSDVYVWEISEILVILLNIPSTISTSVHKYVYNRKTYLNLIDAHLNGEKCDHFLIKNCLCSLDKKLSWKC